MSSSRHPRGWTRHPPESLIDGGPVDGDPSLAISAALGTVPFDCSTGELMSAESGAASLTIWEKYRDQVMGGS